MPIRHDWTPEEIRDTYDQPLLELVYQSATVHRHYHNPRQVQVCQVISVKTGGCPEDCAYCAQASRYKNVTKPEAMMPVEKVLTTARQAIEKGASRICLAAGWREVGASGQFENILEMVKGIAAMGAEVCCTLGMLKAPEAERLRQAGIYAYNHNLDTSEAFYPKIITTRTYKDRLDTLEIVEKTGISVCCGGILGMGESLEDRFALLHTLASRPHHPESVPINLLERVSGTLMEHYPRVPPWELLRMVAVARILMPKAKIRLSGGRLQLTQAEQGLCFLAGANSVHSGDKLLVTATHSYDNDEELFSILGLEKQAAYQTTVRSDP